MEFENYPVDLYVRRLLLVGNVLVFDVRLCRCVLRVRDVLLLDLWKLTHRFGVAHDVQRVLKLRVRLFVSRFEPRHRIAVSSHRLLRIHSSGRTASRGSAPYERSIHSSSTPENSDCIQSTARSMSGTTTICSNSKFTSASKRRSVSDCDDDDDCTLSDDI